MGGENWIFGVLNAYMGGVNCGSIPLAVPFFLLLARRQALIDKIALTNNSERNSRQNAKKIK